MSLRPILLVDVQKKRRTELRKSLRGNSLDIVEAANFGDIEIEEFRCFALVLIAWDKDAGNLFACGRLLRCSDTPVFAVAQNSSEELAIAALRAGVSDYFPLPGSYDELLAAIQRAANAPQPAEDRPVGPPTPNAHPIIGGCSAIRDLVAYAKRVAVSDCNVLITGETGTGKELLAELIHRYSPRRLRPFVCVNCAAIPDTLLESELFGYERGAFTGANWRTAGKLANGEGGTVFLDEIGEMSPCGQAKVLRMIETKEIQRLGSHNSVSVNVRVVAATNKNLEALVGQNLFRKDLYFRLSVATIALLPLRQRTEDIPHLLDYYIKVLNGKYRERVQGISGEAMSRLLHYEWPGNVRELKNLLESIYVNGVRAQIEVADLPQKIRQSAAGYRQSGDQERLTRTLETCKWNKSKAAEQLNWSRMTLYRKMARYGIKSHSGKVADATDTPAQVQPKVS